MKTVAISDKMISVLQDKMTKMYGNREALTTKLSSLSCLSSARENGGKFYLFFEEEVAELLPKNIEKLQKYNSTDESCHLISVD